MLLVSVNAFTLSSMDGIVLIANIYNISMSIYLHGEQFGQSKSEAMIKNGQIMYPHYL